jgi:mycofactocin precursor peptide peptidase
LALEPAPSEPGLRRLAGLTWPQAARLAPYSVLAVPLGATEQHGPHLPFTVDTEVADALCGRLATARESVVVAPALPYGSSGEHAGFPGTLSIGPRALELLLIELVRSADDFAGVVLVCGHGGNAAPLHRAVTRLRTEGRRVLAWSPSGPPEDSHAGRTETSAMLALRPDAVHPEWAEPGNTTGLTELLPALRTGGLAAVTANGVLGDPTGATTREGRQLLDGWAAALLAAYDGWTAAG